MQRIALIENDMDAERARVFDVATQDPDAPRAGPTPSISGCRNCSWPCNS